MDFLPKHFTGGVGLIEGTIFTTLAA